MKVSFNHQKLEDLFNVSLADIGKQPFSKAVIKNYQKRIQILKYANDLSDIAKMAGLNLEKLNGREYKSCYSIRINDQYRVIFKEVGNGEIEILIMELSKHYE